MPFYFNLPYEFGDYMDFQIEHVMEWWEEGSIGRTLLNWLKKKSVNNICGVELK